MSNKSNRIYQPDFDQWGAILQGNVQKSNLVIGAEVFDIARVRSQALLLATQSLNTQSESTSEFFDQVAGKCQIVMSGHQPIIYHPGIQAKLDSIVDLCNGRSNLIGFNLIIDTDSGDAGTIFYPDWQNGKIVLNKISFVSNADKLFLFQTIVDSEQIEKIRTILLKAVSALANNCLANSINSLCNHYSGWAGKSAVLASTHLRRTTTELMNIYELPLSKFVRSVELLKIIANLIADFEKFHTTYNSVLDNFRTTRKIKNHANPFPNLKREEGNMELPFWVIDDRTQSRYPLYVSRKLDQFDMHFGNSNLKGLTSETLYSYLIENQNLIIAPRAMLITIFSRLLLSDLFVHGRGGLKYDACTDIFIKEYFEIEPPAFVVASADQFLFDKQREEFQKAKEILDNKRQIYFHPLRYVDNNLFSKEQVEELKGLISEKESLIEQLKELKKAGKSAAQQTQEIKSIEQTVSKIVDSALEVKFGHYERMTENEVLALNCREYPDLFYNEC